jgi:hypothetical protein
MKIAVFLLMALLVGCASHDSYNQRTSGKVVFRGGVYKKKGWNDPLEFKRMSWYHGMTLYYDVILWKADPESPFAVWFSPAEKEFFTRCESLIVTAGYSADPTKISHVNFREQMKLNGYDDVVINSFANYLKAHPSAQDWRLQNYKVMGYCKRSPTRLNTSNLAINFPSFRQLEIDL